MYDTILFDLDGTLLPFEQERFVGIYFEEMGRKFHDLIEPKQLAKHIWTATEYMVKNTEDRVNADVFMEKFGLLIDGDLSVYQERFDQFYDQGFLKAKDSVTENPLIQESVKMLKQKGYQLAVATNPLFPQKAIFHRIRWAGFQPEDFCYISYYERNHYCKPQIQFYQEMLAELEKQPEQCLMVGNDVQEDIVAMKLGIDTYLIKDYLIHRTSEPIQSRYQGSYQDFYQFVQELPAI